ncbi:MAG: A/G-specific adenine glycosylase [Mariprofundaceae bacterium]|nr:A/G-specific adenine glycosylase [Mariprofundaceae bacterium]
MISHALFDWYKQHARDLPWRHTQQPYAIWISEVMLQQTQVKTVLPRYAAWFKHFPDIQSLAAADLDQVLKQWEGLGYYRRARFIHAAAIRIVQQHGGVFPQDMQVMMQLPGIGRSTAGAIAAFCFGQASPVLDANVKRVFSAWNHQTYNDKDLWQIAQTWMLDVDRPDMWNQALMELGATHCQAKKRNCAACPVSEWCLSAFTPPEKKPKKAKSKDVYWQVQLFLCAKRGIWLQQRPDSGIWAGLWTPPIVELDKKPEKTADILHVLTHRRLHLQLIQQSTVPQGSGRWANNRADYAIPTGIQRLLTHHQLDFMSD